MKTEEEEKVSIPTLEESKADLEHMYEEAKANLFRLEGAMTFVSQRIDLEKKQFKG
tara:strand:+ start:985 stop:1152 length:168 start_codon:yes stop_codon:yes gene_type:complete